ncbi:MAG TPA: tryptophan synthase subunit alpha [Terriglobales bacterium]|nr:tryptophan synthase subunit alpha [Terriglobales bacterium]
MRRIALGNRGDHPGLVVYVTVGDPDMDTSRRIVIAAIDAGADVVELGVPFSDPVADGPVIQRASERALKNGTSVKDVLRLAGEVRGERPQAGLLIFSYLNPLLRMGLKAFADGAKAAGVDGALVTDLPIEEAHEYMKLMSERELATVFLAAPTSTDQRVKLIAQASTGFIYAVSRTGVTGAQASMADDAHRLVKRIKKASKLPVAVGFGVSTPEHFREVGHYADAVVVGSAIMKLVEESGKESPARVAEFIQRLKA